MQKNFCYHCLKVRIMYKDRYNDSLVRFFSVYYEKISENEVKSIINYTLGLKNDRFSRFIENGKRVDNILCIFRKNRALAPHERSAVPLGTDHCPVG